MLSYSENNTDSTKGSRGSADLKDLCPKIFPDLQPVQLRLDLCYIAKISQEVCSSLFTNYSLGTRADLGHCTRASSFICINLHYRPPSYEPCMSWRIQAEPPMLGLRFFKLKQHLMSVEPSTSICFSR